MDSAKRRGASFRECLLYLLLGIGLSLAFCFFHNGPADMVGKYYTPQVSTFASSLRLAIQAAHENTILWVNQRRLDEGNASPKTTRAQFILTMSLLGDGAFQKQLGGKIGNSQVMEKLEAAGVVPELLVELHELLYYGGQERKTGFWNAHCNVQQTKASARSLQTRVVQKLREIQTAVTDSPLMDDLPVLPIPINLVNFPDKNNTEDSYGLVTYPTEFSHQGCHKLDFASLDLFYEACQNAHVDCRHIYASELPNNLVSQALQRAQKSQEETKKKPFVTHLATLHHYNTMLHIISSQLAQFAPRTLGCMHHSNWKSLWGDLWGIDEADLISSSTIFPSQDGGEANFGKIVPEWTKPYIDSFHQLHKMTLFTCQQSLRQAVEIRDAST